MTSWYHDPIKFEYSENTEKNIMMTSWSTDAVCKGVYHHHRKVMVDEAELML